MNPRIRALVIEFLSQYPYDSDKDFSVILEDGTVVDKIGTDIWISTIRLNIPNNTDTDNISHD